MKKIITLLSIIFLLTNFTEIKAQDENYPWQINFGSNAVDLDVDRYTPIGEYFNVQGNWNFSKSPISMFSVSKYLGNDLSIGLGGSFNSIYNYAENRELPGVTNDYFSVDLMLKYDLSNLFTIPIPGLELEPFVGLGPGKLWMSDQSHFTANLSFGVNHWLTETFGLMFMTEFKHNLDDIDQQLMYDEGGTLRHSIMLMIKFGKSK